MQLLFTFLAQVLQPFIVIPNVLLKALLRPICSTNKIGDFATGKQSKAGLNRIINDVRGRKVVRALQSAMIIGSSQAALYTPIDTSTLLNSQYRELINNGLRLTGRVGYTANYAVFVHDPNVPQTFRRATAQKEFLTKGFEDTRSQIDAVMRKELSV